MSSESQSSSSRGRIVIAVLLLALVGAGIYWYRVNYGAEPATIAQPAIHRTPVQAAPKTPAPTPAAPATTPTPAPSGN